MSKLTQARLKEVLHYDKRTGVFTWRVDVGNQVQAGTRAGCRATQKDHTTIRIRVDGKLYLAHRLAWLWVRGQWPPKQVDHEDRNPSNNAWGNLRLATNKQNMENTCVRSGSKSGVVGVSWDSGKGRWHAQIGHNGEVVHLGHYVELEPAIAARKAAEKLYFTHAPA